MKKIDDPVAHFWSRLSAPTPTSCWEWQGSCNNTGYGTLVYEGRGCVAHRVAAYITGLVASPLAPKRRSDHGHVLHKCDNRKCCNPSHLFVGTCSDNMLDMYAKKRHVIYKGATHTNAKLTKEQAAEIRAKYAAGAKQIPLAAAYGVSQAVISKITLGRTYQ